MVQLVGWRPSWPQRARPPWRGLARSTAASMIARHWASEGLGSAASSSKRSTSSLMDWAPAARRSSVASTTVEEAWCCVMWRHAALPCILPLGFRAGYLCHLVAVLGQVSGCAGNTAVEPVDKATEVHWAGGAHPDRCTSGWPAIVPQRADRAASSRTWLHTQCLLRWIGQSNNSTATTCQLQYAVAI